MKWGGKFATTIAAYRGCRKITGKFKTWESLHHEKGDDEHFDNKSLKVIGGMGITCRRGWGAKWNEVENHLRKMRTYVIRRRSITRICYCDAHYLYEINEKWILGAVSLARFFFFLEYTYGRVKSSVNQYYIRARMEKMLNDPENIHTHKSYDGGQIRFFMEASFFFCSFIYFFLHINACMRNQHIKNGDEFIYIQLNMHRRVWNNVKKLLTWI